MFCSIQLAEETILEFILLLIHAVKFLIFPGSSFVLLFFKKDFENFPYFCPQFPILLTLHTACHLVMTASSSLLKIHFVLMN